MQQYSTRHDQQQRFGQPQRMIGKMRRRPSAQDCAEQKTRADDPQFSGLRNVLVPGLGIGVDEVADESFREIAKIAGDEGGVVGESSHPPKGRYLERRDERDDPGKDDVRERQWQQTGDKEDDDFEPEYRQGRTGAGENPQKPRGCYSSEEGDQRGGGCEGVVLGGGANFWHGSSRG